MSLPRSPKIIFSKTPTLLALIQKSRNLLMLFNERALEL